MAWRARLGKNVGLLPRLQLHDLLLNNPTIRNKSLHGDQLDFRVVEYSILAASSALFMSQKSASSVIDMISFLLASPNFPHMGCRSGELFLNVGFVIFLSRRT